jgi:DHA1 family multidrug resistance protein-like MFS transporter
MADLIREAPIGQIIRFLTRNRHLQYPEEKPDFQCPSCYSNPDAPPDTSLPVSSSSIIPNSVGDEEKVTHRRTLSNASANGTTLEPILSRVRTLQYTEQRLDDETLQAAERAISRPVIPSRLDDGTILVDWYTTDDPANPQNWSSKKRGFVSLLICLYTVAVYTGSAIYVAAEEGVKAEFNVGPTKASLGLAIYVLGYGMGPLLFSPLSEMPALGRNVPYLTSFFLFMLLSIGTALTPTFAGLIILRFLQGFLGSPCLATGGASMGDMYSLIKLPYALTAWVSAAYCGPALGPLLSGFSVPVKGWRWALWEIVWMSAPVLVMFMLFLPETSASNILLRRAQRLRKLTGDNRLKSQSEIDAANMKLSAVVWDAMIKPAEITLLDPSVLFVNVYTALIYGIYYSFFEVFPLVYPVMYHFSLGDIGLAFLCVVVACLCGVIVYLVYYRFYLEPDIMANGLRAQETRLIPALFACFGPPIGLFLFGWTSNPKIHWIVSIIGITIYGATVFVVMQCIFVYIPLSYPQYAASLFASNDFLRSALACGAILFARPLYLNLGVSRGVSLLAGLASGCVLGMFALWYFGASLRARSKFTVKG